MEATYNSNRSGGETESGHRHAALNAQSLPARSLPYVITAVQIDNATQTEAPGDADGSIQ